MMSVMSKTKEDVRWVVQVKYKDTDWDDVFVNHYSESAEDAHEVLETAKQIVDVGGKLRVVERTDTVV